MLVQRSTRQINDTPVGSTMAQTTAKLAVYQGIEGALPTEFIFFFKTN